MAFGPGEVGYGVPGIEPRRARGRAWLALVGLLIVAAPALVYLGLYNNLVSRLEAVDGAWAQIESAHQRRADLVPALVETVKRHTRYEADTLVAVVQARADAVRRLGAAQPPADPEGLARVARAQSELGLGLAQLFAVAESHPELRAADSFLELQAQLEGAENRIHVARVAFNDAVRAYNAAIEKLPAVWIAEARGLERRSYFESEDGSERVRPLGLD
jgi:LemA protein